MDSGGSRGEFSESRVACLVFGGSCFAPAVFFGVPDLFFSGIRTLWERFLQGPGCHAMLA